MMDEDAGLTLNITESNVPLKKKKRVHRFYGKNNFRHLKKIGKTRRDRKKLKSGFSQGRVKAGPIKKLNTAKLKISVPSLLEEKSEYKAENVDGSTALHFKAVEVLPKEPSKLFKKKRERTKKHDEGLKKIQPDEVTDDKHNAMKSKGPWKSSLFNQNPEIPKVQQAEIRTVKEDVFSGKQFSDLKIHPYLLSCITSKLQLESMTSIQQGSIPILLDGKDALIKSQTGSGKTLAYAVPVVHKIQEITPQITRKDGPIALILVPTRELALQSYNLFSKLTVPFCRIVPTWIIGGENRKSEKARIRKGVNILIGTPGRILDHIQTTHSLSLKNLRWIVFDEADRLLDMGFQKQVDGILKAANQQGTHKRQTVLLSATLSEKVECLASLALTDPINVHVSPGEYDDSEEEKDENFALPERLTQHVAVIPSKLRLVSLVTFLRTQLARDSSCKVIVFLSCRDSVEFHYHLLKHILRRPKTMPEFSLPLDVDLDETEMEEIELFQLHGGLTQNERKDVFNNFISAPSGTLLSTDVAARGLDLPSVDWVVQYTCPTSPVEYIHRAGRTARAGKAGNALLMMTPSEVKYINLLTQYSIQVQEMTVNDILTSTINLGKTKKTRNLNDHFVERAKDSATSLQNQIEFYVSKNRKIGTMAKTAYASFIRAYATYPADLKSIFHVKHLHLGHVAKSFGLREAPSDIVQNLQKSVGHLPIKSSFEHREARKEASQKEDEKENAEKEEEVTEEKPRLSRKQLMRKKMSQKPDLMSEYSSGFNVVPHKKSKR